MTPQGLTLTLPGTMLGTRIGIELECVPEGFRFVLAIRDPRDPLKRDHRLETVLPTAGQVAARAAAPKGAAEA